MTNNVEIYFETLLVINVVIILWGNISYSKSSHKLLNNVFHLFTYVYRRKPRLFMTYVISNLVLLVMIIYGAYLARSFDMHSLFVFIRGAALLVFSYSYSTNFSYRFHVNNKNFNFVASSDDVSKYKINNILLFISVVVIGLLKIYVF